MANSITTATNTAGTAGGTASQITAAIMEVYSREVYHAAQPVLMFNQVATPKVDLEAVKGLTIKFLRFNDLSKGTDVLTENTEMEREAVTATSFSISVKERGKAVSVTELSIQASYADLMREGARKLGNAYAQNTDGIARDTLIGAPGLIRASDRTDRADFVSGDVFNTDIIDDAIEQLAEAKAPKFNGESYVCFITPSQAKSVQNDPEWQAVQHYAQPETRINGEIGRYNDVRFVRTTQVRRVNTSGDVFADGADTTVDLADYSTNTPVDQAIIVGEHALGHAIAKPVEMRDDGVHDFYRDRRIGYYTIDGHGLVESTHVVTLESARG